MNFNIKQQLKDPNVKVLAALMLWFKKNGGNGHIAGIYDSADPLTIKTQCADAKAFGYAGFAMDLYPDQFDIALAIKKEAMTQGLELCAMLEGRYGLAALSTQMQWVRDNLIKGNSLYSRIGGKPIVFEFGFRENNVNPDDFQKANPDILLLCQSTATLSAPHNYGWVNLSAGYAGRVNPAATIPGLWWQFDDSLASWGSGRKLPANNGVTLQECIDTINARSVAPAYALLSTWNDYEEGTAIEKQAAAQLAAMPKPVLPAKIDYAANIKAAGDWLVKQQTVDGAILFGSDAVNPYYGNLAAIGMCKMPELAGRVKNWLQWYVDHLNCPDKWGMAGTIYDYAVLPGNVPSYQSKNDADSTDSYAASFLSLAWSCYETGVGLLQDAVKQILAKLFMIADSLLLTQQSDGCTWAKPDYQIKYLMDNCEVYRGLRDFAALLGALGVPANKKYYDSRADQVLKGINGMWMFGSWAIEHDTLTKADLSKWYPDATAQLFPVMQGVLLPGDPKAQQSYAAFTKAWPAWSQLVFNKQDPFPWVMVAYTAALMGDYDRVDAYLREIGTRYVAKGFPWPFYCAEAGWFMRLNAFMRDRK